MIKKSFGELFKNTLVTFVHWVLVILLSLVSYKIQYSFMTSLGIFTGGLFASEVFAVNIPMFIIGVAVFFVGFYIMWNKLLYVDWQKLDGQSIIWKILFVMITIVGLFSLMIAGVLMLFLHTGLGGYLTPKWTEYTAFFFPVYAILVICRIDKKIISMINA